MYNIKNIFLIIFTIISLSFFSCTEDPYQIPEPDTTPPQALVIFPIDGEPVSGNVTIQARANDNEGVKEVLFYINQEFVGKDTTTKSDIATFEWDTDLSEQDNDEGTLIRKYEDDKFHFISVVAYDISDNKYSSVPIRSFVDNIDSEAPNAFFLTPFSGQYLTGLANITVVATDNVGVQYVSYFINNVLQGYVLPEENSSSFDYPWNTTLVQSGDYYSIYANVRDVNNNITIIPPISVYVDNGTQIDITPPNGAIVSPPAGISISGEVQIIISASDNRAMGEVFLTINSELMDIIENEPYSYTWDTTNEEEDSDHIISVILSDLAGNETPLNPISVTVDNDPLSDVIPPYITIMEPVAGQSVSGVVSIEVDAEDESGISHIEYFIDGTLVSTDTLSPFSYDWITNDYGDDQEHIIYVIAYDIEGNFTHHQPIAVYVDNDDNIKPYGQIQNPIPGQIVNGFITIQISAEDNIAVNNVELSINGNIIDSLFSSPFSYSWNTELENEDQYSVISAIIRDNSQNQFSVPPISVLVNNEINDMSPPTGSISNPVSGQIVNEIVNFTVLAQDDVSIDEVLFFIDGVQVYTDDTEPYVYEWDTTILVNSSQHTLSATVRDDAENIILLQPIIVTVENE